MPQHLTEQLSREQQIAVLEKDWATNPRWKGIKRGYSAADVVRLRGSFPIDWPVAVPRSSGTCCTPRLTSTPWVR